MPPNGSAAVGTGFVILDSAEANITVLLSFSGLGGNATAGHIHGPALAGGTAPVLFPLAPPAATSGTVPPATFAVTPQQVSDLKAGLWYFNIHTAAFPAGETRGQIGGAKTYTATLAGTQEVPPSGSAGTGYGVVVLNTAETTIAVTLSFSGLGTNAVAGHIHGPAPAGMNAPVIFPLTPPSATSGSVPPVMFAITPVQVTDLNNGQHYFNIHTTGFGGGEIRGQISLAKYYLGSLTGTQEVPPNASPGTGTGTVTLENFETTITVFVRFAGLGANANAGHIHGPAGPGATAPVIFPLAPPAATSGDVPVATFTITPAQVTDLKNGLHYFNIHTGSFPAGEIRGQIATSVVPVELVGFTVE